ncbi:MAG: flagellar motor protein MotD [Pseudomonadota bacterium]
MARRRRHRFEEHANHESWAIPYGDLMTLLLAFFVVMYAISSVNEGKYRVLSDSMVAAFRGTPLTDPVWIGQKQSAGGTLSPLNQVLLQGPPKPLPQPKPVVAPPNPQAAALQQMAAGIEDAMRSLIDANLVVVRRHDNWVEVEIKTDILFPSGVARLSPEAGPVFALLADALKPFPNQIRVEGHTDNRPIKTAAFPSNWELSAGRAASVVHLLTSQGMDPQRLSVVAYSEFRPLKTNTTEDGRNANRRVVLIIVSDAPGAGAQQLDSVDSTSADNPAPAPAPGAMASVARAVAAP